jgi:hypothetical protein
MQIRQQDLEIQHELIFLQTAFATQGLRVNGVPGDLALSQDLPQLTAARAVEDDFLDQAAAALGKPLGDFSQAGLPLAQPPLALAAGLSLGLPLGEFGLQVFDLLFEGGLFLPIVLAETRQAVPQVAQGFLLGGQLALTGFHTFLCVFPLALPRAIGHGLGSVAIVGVEIRAGNHLPNDAFLMQPALPKAGRD